MPPSKWRGHWKGRPRRGPMAHLGRGGSALRGRTVRPPDPMLRLNVCGRPARPAFVSSPARRLAAASRCRMTAQLQPQPVAAAAGAEVSPVFAKHSVCLVLDYGSQYTQLIARRVRDNGVLSMLLPGDAPLVRPLVWGAWRAGSGGICRIRHGQCMYRGTWGWNSVMCAHGLVGWEYDGLWERHACSCGGEWGLTRGGARGRGVSGAPDRGAGGTCNPMGPRAPERRTARRDHSASTPLPRTASVA